MTGLSGGGNSSNFDNKDRSDDNYENDNVAGVNSSNYLEVDNADDNSGDGSSDRGNNDDNNQSAPERWILVLAVTILAFGFILLALRSVIFSLIFIVIGMSLFTYWLYVGVRSREQQHLFTDYNLDQSSNIPGARGAKQVCTCPICKHTESKICLKRRCPCCILTRNKQIIGHFSN